VTEPLPNHEAPVTEDGVGLLDDLITKYGKALADKYDGEPKLGDFLKMLETRRKLAPENKEKKELWDLLRKIRNSSLAEHPIAQEKPASGSDSATLPTSHTT